MDRIREIVAEVERALGSTATVAQVEAVAGLVLERLRGDSPVVAPVERSQAPSEYAIVTATGPNSRAILALLSNVLADSGAVIEEVSQTTSFGVIALAIRIDVSGVTITFAELKARLKSCAAGQDVRVSIHRADLYAVMVTT